MRELLTVFGVHSRRPVVSPDLSVLETGEVRADLLMRGVFSGRIALVMVDRLVDSDGHHAIAELIVGTDPTNVTDEGNPIVTRMAIVMSKGVKPGERERAVISFERQLRGLSINDVGDSVGDRAFLDDVSRVTDAGRLEDDVDFSRFSPHKYNMVIQSIARSGWAVQ